MLSLVGCQQMPEKQKFTAYYFDWFDTVTIIYGYEETKEDFDAVMADVEQEFEKYHKLYDIYFTYEGINNIATLNDADDAVEVDSELIDLIEYSKELYNLTEGKFNVAMGSVLKIWHYYRNVGKANPDQAELPSVSELKTAAEHTDIDKIIIDKENGTAYLADRQMSLDVGAIAKGYACEQVAKHLEEKGIEGYLISSGGNIRTIGSKPDGSGWSVAIKNPDVEDLENPYIAKLNINGQSLVTSGTYERFYSVDGKNYHHIIDPETLMPSERYMSISILCNDSGLGDALSTALFNMEFEQGKSLVDSLENVEALWVMSDGEVRQTDNFYKYVDLSD